MDVEIKKQEKSSVEIKVTIPAETFESHREKAIKNIQKEFEMPGFRKGQVPEKILLANISEMVILEDMAEMAISEAYPKILEEHKIDAIGRPNVMITKLGKGSTLECKIHTSVMPEVKLGDYKKIAAKNNKGGETVAVTDEEVEKVITDLRKVRAKENQNPDELGEKVEIKDEDLPEVNEEFAKSFGAFETVDALKEKIKENLTLEKDSAAKEKIRLATMEAIIADSTIEVPEILINAELDKMMFRLGEDIKQVGLTFEGYLKHLNKTEADLRAEFTPDAEKRAKLELAIFNIAETENLKPTEEEIQKEVGHVMEHYKGADPERAHSYVENMLTNEKVFKFLEEQK